MTAMGTDERIMQSLREKERMDAPGRRAGETFFSLLSVKHAIEDCVPPDCMLILLGYDLIIRSPLQIFIRLRGNQFFVGAYSMEIKDFPQAVDVLKHLLEEDLPILLREQNRGYCKKEHLGRIMAVANEIKKQNEIQNGNKHQHHRAQKTARKHPAFA